MPHYPYLFAPIYKDRVWGGRRLELDFGRILPGSGPIGESWELTDRAEGVSVVANGSKAGKTLRDLIEADAVGVMGDAPLLKGRFPLLVKILDAREVLSLQVHPPAAPAAALGGEPKTEMWYFVGAGPGSEIFAGIKRGVSREVFETSVADGTVARCFHRIPVRAGDAMLLPSGRVHALGAGLLLFEIQQNSDTTYRVFDWNRKGLDGRPRPLHVPESLQSIDFTDFEPGLLVSEWAGEEGLEVKSLVADPLFQVEVRRGRSGARWNPVFKRCRVVGVVSGRLSISGGGETVRLGAGDFCLLPAGLGTAEGRIESDTEWLVAEPGAGPREQAEGGSGRREKREHGA